MKLVMKEDGGRDVERGNEARIFIPIRPHSNSDYPDYLHYNTASEMLHPVPSLLSYAFFPRSCAASDAVQAEGISPIWDSMGFVLHPCNVTR